MAMKTDVLRIIKALGYPIVFLCQLFGVSRQSFYNYIDYYCQGSQLPKKLSDFFDIITTDGVSKRDVNEYLLSLCNRDVRFGEKAAPIPQELLKFHGVYDLKDGCLVVNKTPVISDRFIYTDLADVVRDARAGALRYADQVVFSNYGFVGIPDPDQYRIVRGGRKLTDLYRTYFHLMFISTYIRSSGMLSSGLHDISSILDVVDYEMQCIEYVFKNLDETDSDELPVLLSEVNRDTFDVSRKVYWFIVAIVYKNVDNDAPVELYSRCLRAVDVDDAVAAVLESEDRVIVHRKFYNYVVFGPYKDELVALTAEDHLTYSWKDESDSIGPSMTAASDWLNGMARKKSMQWSDLQ